MTALLQRAGITGKLPTLHVERTSIVFADRAPGLVHIEIEIENIGDETTRPAEAVISAAPLGAFVDWQPLALLPVPAMRPGQTHILRTEALRPAPAPLGPPDRIAPRQLLTALGAEDQRPRKQPQREAKKQPGTLPFDLFELCGHTNPHWAGNLNVFIGAAPVERHVARALRVYPGCLNTAFFIVGSGPDDYAFELSGTGTDWQAALYSMDGQNTLRVDPARQTPIAENDWVHIEKEECLVLALVPPAACTTGSVDVEVTKRSTDERAIVEFTLDASASGPGCFVVS
ncbi:MAG: hypothetical protein AB7K24_17725 [Gemmataceae bacterium]